MYTVTFHKTFKTGTLSGLTVPVSFQVPDLPRAEWHLRRIQHHLRHGVEGVDTLTNNRWMVAESPEPMIQ